MPERILLYSFPGSGNTWLRLMLENVTGIYTGSVYHDEALREIGMHGEDVTNNTVLLVKDHGNKKGFNFDEYDKVVFLVRNPFDAIIAERKRRLNGHVGTPPWPTFLSPVRDADGRRILDWERWTDMQMAWWVSMVFRTLGGNGIVKRASGVRVPVLTIRFDELVAQPREKVRAILDFIGQPTRLADCLDNPSAVTSAKRDAAKSEYPKCLYGQEALGKLVQMGTPFLQMLNYTMSPACREVMEGRALGGRDAVPAPFSQPT